MITRAAFSRGLPLIDLRLLCDEDLDYANPIEPSVAGGAKIAAAIARLVTGDAPGSRVVATASHRLAGQCPDERARCAQSP